MPYDIIIGRNESDRKDFGTRGIVYIGKGYVKMGQHVSLSNKIFLDVARTHVVLIAGKRGCLTEDTLVFTDKGYKEIINFNEKEDKVLSFNKETKKFEWEKAELLIYPIKNEDLLQIELKDGRIINVTNEHPLLSSYGKYQFYRRACDLKINDKLVLPTTLPEVKKDKESLRIARLLGFILADGSIGIRKGKFKDGRGREYNGIKARIRIHNACEEVLSQAKKDFEKEFNITAKRYYRNDCNCEIVETKHQKIANKFIKLGVPKGHKSGIIRIPKIVFESSNAFKSEFISSLFDCDGYIPPSGKNIDYSSKSRKFLEDLQILLTHFNIESVIRIKDSKLNGKIFRNYRLFITDNESVKNFKKIGFNNKYKQKRLDNHKHNSTRRRKTHYISKNLVCTKIKSINKLKGIKNVYDLSVDRNHSFIANGIISHNSGKSYTMGVIAEQLADLPTEVSQNVASIIFDTMGIYWTMKYKNEKDTELLRDWDLGAKNLPVKIFVPFGHFDDHVQKGVAVDEKFALNPMEMSAEDWVSTFGLELTDPVGVIIVTTVTKLKESGEKFDIKSIIENLELEERSSQDTKNAAIGLFQAANSWGIFAKRGMEPTQVTDLVNGGTMTVLDLSVYNSIGAFNVRALTVSLVSRKLFEQRMAARKKEEISAINQRFEISLSAEKKEMPLVWMFIDEAHEFLPKDGKTIATDALVQLLREGRQPGISMVIATQQPGKIHGDVMTQSDIVLAHRVTSAQDIGALNSIMQTYMLNTISQYMNNLPSLKGSAIILDDNSERIYPLRMHPRFTWHGGEAPMAVKKEKKL